MNRIDYRALWLVMAFAMASCANQMVFSQAAFETEKKVIAAYNTIEGDKLNGRITAKEQTFLIAQVDKISKALDKAYEYHDLGDHAGADSNLAIAEGMLKTYLLKKVMEAEQ